jgi:alkanesulfonate monooxygenase SsuD/methylene tetrahydromethanopterin reductase-like flavin-dependent oxidoreductase (luciferase family)
MKISLWPNPTLPPAEVLDASRWADEAGWYGIWFPDHYMPNTGTDETSTGPLHECWAMLPAIAAVTESVRIGPLVSPTTVHHPALLANRAASIDHISNGRMVLGMGAGWQVNEHRAYGIDLPPPGPRVDRFEEAIQIVRSLLTEDRTTFEGEVFTVVDAPCDPAPVQSPLPLLVGTASPRMLRITARHADEWNTWGDPDLAGERRRGFLAACDDVGRDPATMWTSVQAMLTLTDGDSSTGESSGRSIAGSADRLVEALGRYGDLGFDEFILPAWNLGESAGARQEALERLDVEVLSVVR